MRRGLHLGRIPPPRLGDLLQDAWPGLFKTIKVMKNKDRLRSCHKPEETEETHETKCDWDRKKTLMEKRVKVWGLVSRNVQRLVS